MSWQGKGPTLAGIFGACSTEFIASKHLKKNIDEGDPITHVKLSNHLESWQHLIPGQCSSWGGHSFRNWHAEIAPYISRKLEKTPCGSPNITAVISWWKDDTNQGLLPLLLSISAAHDYPNTSLPSALSTMRDLNEPDSIFDPVHSQGVQFFWFKNSNLRFGTSFSM